MMTWGKFDLSRSLLPVGAANAQNVALNNIIQGAGVTVGMNPFNLSNTEKDEK